MPSVTAARIRDRDDRGVVLPVDGEGDGLGLGVRTGGRIEGEFGNDGLAARQIVEGGLVVADRAGGGVERELRGRNAAATGMSRVIGQRAGDVFGLHVVAVDVADRHLVGDCHRHRARRAGVAFGDRGRIRDRDDRGVVLTVDGQGDGFGLGVRTGGRIEGEFSNDGLAAR